MYNRSFQVIQHIIEEAKTILEFTDGFNLDTFIDDKKTRYSVTQALGNIGELERALDSEFKNKHSKLVSKV